MSPQGQSQPEAPVQSDACMSKYQSEAGAVLPRGLLQSSSGRFEIIIVERCS